MAVDPRFKSDEIIHLINREFIRLDKAEILISNQYLKTVLDSLIDCMKGVDPMFNACYVTCAYVGSSYEGLKVARPEEFDLNFIIKLPIDYNCLTHEADETPGYVKIRADADVLPKLQKHNRWTLEYKVMNSWFDENSYLNQNKFRSWFESVVIRAFGSLSSNYETCRQAGGTPQYTLFHKKSGPAWTLKICIPDRYIVDVDLVPVLDFTTSLPKPFKDHNIMKWFSIPKPTKELNDDILWRPSFYEKERGILTGNSKPAIRLIKKLRDTQNFGDIASYYIKTLFLWEFTRQEQEFQKWSLTFLFFHMLRKLQEACANHKILDFWNPENNLLSKIGEPRMFDISCRLTKIIIAIDRRITDDLYVIAEFILTEAELEQLKGSQQENGGEAAPFCSIL